MAGSRGSVHIRTLSLSLSALLFSGVVLLLGSMWQDDHSSPSPFPVWSTVEK